MLSFLQVFARSLVPKLQLGNSVLEALASCFAKLELRLLGSQAGALVVIHNASATKVNPVSPIEKGGLGGIFQLSVTPQIPPGPPFSKGGVHDLDLCITMRAGVWEPAQKSTSFRQGERSEGWPESRRHGWLRLTIPGTGYPLPGGYDGLFLVPEKGMGI